MFLMLWLHAYKYTYNDIVVKTKKPEWTLPEFKIKDALIDKPTEEELPKKTE